MLTDDERALLRHLESNAGLPIVERGGKWTWEFRSVTTLRTFDTEAEARDAFARYLAVLMDAERAELALGYRIEASDG